MQRSSRRFRLTNEGALLYERACSILAQMQDVEAEVASRGSVARGTLRVGAPTEFGRRYVAPIVGAFTRLHPGLHTYLGLSDVGLEAGEDAFDVVLRVGLPNDEATIVRKVASSPCVICVAPAYLAGRALPTKPDDLAGHDCLMLARRNQVANEWSFTHNGETSTFKVGGSLSSGSGDVLHSWVLSGYGVSREAAWDVADDLASGRLVPLLADYQPTDIDIFAMFAASRLVPLRIRLFMDFLTERMTLLQRKK